MIKFSAFFQEWLYAPDGYYAKIPEIGKHGDFYTSVSASHFFGGCIANHLITQIKKGILPNNLAVCEVGVHKGYLISDVIDFICELPPSLLNNLEFAVVDRFGDSEKIKKHCFAKNLDNKLELKYYRDIEQLKIQSPNLQSSNSQFPSPNSAFVFANEIFDAFACELIDDGKMAFIDENDKEDNCDISLRFNVMNDETRAMAAKYNLAKSELAVGYEEFAQNLSETFNVSARDK